MPDDPLWINAATGAPAYAANELRRLHAMYLTQAVGDKFGARSGVHPAGGNAVSLSGTTITVLHTKAVVYPGLTSTAGPYVVALQSRTHTLTAADGSNPRKDIVVLRVWDNDEDALGLRQADTEYIVGDPAASPVEKPVPSGAFRMATIDVPQSGGGSAVLTFNAPYTVATGGVLPVRNDAELPGGSSGLYDGMMRWNRDTDQLQVHDGGTTWETLASISAIAPGTIVAHLQRSADQALTDTLASSSATAISWDTEVLDRLDCWSSGTNPDRYQPNVAGWYKLDGMVSFDPDTDGLVRGAAWRKNGVAIDGNVSRAHLAGTGTNTATAIAVPMAVSMNGTTDYIELVGLHDGGADMVTANSGFRCSLTVVYGGPL